MRRRIGGLSGDLIALNWLEQKPLTEFESLQLALLKLSFDADVVIDLHCSLEAAMHLYTSEAAWPEFEPLVAVSGRAGFAAGDQLGR